MATAQLALCPLCHGTAVGPSWLRGTIYNGKLYPYAQCQTCRSHFCSPMPDADTLSCMYGREYRQGNFGAGCQQDDPKQPARVVDWLKKTTPPGTFVDYGCGKGDLLRQAAECGWRAIGIEYDAQVARSVSDAAGVEVHSLGHGHRLAGVADVLHLGDVIEHLTDVEEQMPAILRLLKPGGTLLAQGPLEGQMSLFNFAIKMVRALRGYPPARMPPYHVLLATAQGQRSLFGRFGMEELVYQVHEVSWPAPARFGRALLRHPRSLALFTLRRLSMGVTRLSGSGQGNRYFYAGRL